jgi:hypothetical protein
MLRLHTLRPGGAALDCTQGLNMAEFREGVIMRPVSMILSTSLLLLASGASAQTQYYLSTESGVTSQVQVVAPAQPFSFRADDADAVGGAYSMSNGWRLQVGSAPEGIVAQINQRYPISLTAVSRDKYITSDGHIWMEFNRGKDGDQMLMSYIPDARTRDIHARIAQTGVVTISATLAQR